MLFYSSEDNAALAAFLDASKTTRGCEVAPLEGETLGAQIDAVVGRRRGVSAYAVDVTSPDVAELGSRSRA